MQWQCGSLLYQVPPVKFSLPLKLTTYLPIFLLVGWGVCGDVDKLAADIVSRKNIAGTLQLCLDFH